MWSNRGKPIPPEIAEMNLTPELEAHLGRYLGIEAHLALVQRRLVLGGLVIGAAVLLQHSVFSSMNDPTLPFEPLLAAVQRYFLIISALVFAGGIGYYQFIAYRVRKQFGQLGFSVDQHAKARKLGRQVARYGFLGPVGVLLFG